MSVFVALSTVADGSMYNPDELENAVIKQHRKTWLETMNITPEETVRVHISYDEDDFCRYRVVDIASAGEGMTRPSMGYVDALVTTDPGVALLLPIADCVATTLYDPTKAVLMVSHLGRHSLEQDGGVRSVAFLKEQFGVDPAALQVWLSPAPNKEVYPIFKLGGMGMKEAVYEQLARAGVLARNITDNTDDTATDDRYYSHSEFMKGNKAEDGRFAMVAVMR